MSRDIVNDICRAQPGAEWSDPWGGGHDAWKVGGKMFACIGSMGDGVSVKTPSVEDAQLLIDLQRATRAPYFHRSWVLLDWDAIPPVELRDRIETSYRIVFSKLTKKAQRAITGN
ncbi:MmcQ/YjbR family DNA-binding protein [Antarctobacter heliothermus]|uniref:Predicted DNA-binding protein, MmcQ/YjbR family n=1 Tax=Antarctobacter heliothermus TaxID=74033 RepID=A0A239AR10_9RHOB|nr:MmcQ/YjbR family DNA-binding protein [Antarctobacter heliothermus]SNR97373.1 Predicted DNA-binding protein, MmcQ/YjbR family [Antarctobacter heliothermus]